MAEIALLEFTAHLEIYLIHPSSKSKAKKDCKKLSEFKSQELRILSNSDPFWYNYKKPQ